MKNTLTKTTKDMEENNKLIAEFMGCAKSVTTELNDFGGVESHRADAYVIDGVSIPISQIKYHTSWDWLMPVIEKIEDLGYSVGYTGRMTVITSPKSLKPFYRSSHSDRMRMDNLYDAAIQFINWYNSNKLNHEQ